MTPADQTTILSPEDVKESDPWYFRNLQQLTVAAGQVEEFCWVQAAGETMPWPVRR